MRSRSLRATSSSTRPRACAVACDQGPLSKAARAAATARPVSSAVARAAWAITLPLAGLTTGWRSGSAPATNLPSM